jgi:hypothetical protein
MALNIERNKEFVKRFSDAKAWVVECDAKGTMQDTWEALPHMSAPKVDMKEETAELKDGSNATIHKSVTLDCFEFTCDLLQADKATIDLIKNARTKLYMLIYKVGIIKGAEQYWFLGPGTISATGGPDYSDFVKIPFVFTTLKNDTDIPASGTLTLPAEVPSGLQSKFTIVAGDQAELIEEARNSNNSSS